MAADMSVEKACGQILFCLKTSNLNYMVKETPFSAYVTIRKKFLKNFTIAETNSENHTQDDQNTYVKKLERDNALLTKKVKDILTENAHLRFDLEEFEIKFNALEKDNYTLEIKLDEAKQVERNSKEEESKSAKALSECKSLTAKLREVEKINKDKSDIVDILENTVSNKAIEISSLKEEFETVRNLQFSCIFCDYKTKTEDELTSHVRKYHDEKCNKCDLAFESRNKLRDHTCKVYIHNPTYGNCYLKDWIPVNGCTAIYNRATKTEIVTLHFEDCWRRIMPCAELNTLNQMDSNEIFHAKISRFIRNGRVNWSDLMIELNA